MAAGKLSRNSLRAHGRLFSKVVALAGILSCCVPQSKAQDTASEKKTFNIHGTVLNSVTREPIGRALVVSADNRFATLTDEQGHFEFTLPETGPDKSGETGSSTGTVFRFSPERNLSYPAALTARKPGFLSYGPGVQNFQPAIPNQDLTILLVPEAAIVGRVVFPTTDGSDKVEVEIYRRQVQDGRGHWISAGRVTTRSSGEFRFTELAAGTYKLFTHELLDRDPLTFNPRGQLYGYPPVYFPAAPDFASGGTISLSPGKIFQADLTPVRRAYYPVKVPLGNVVAGIPLGIGIVVSLHGHRGPGYSLGYNDKTQTIEGMLPDGTYSLQAIGFGPKGASGLVNITVKGAAVRGPTMTLVPNASISVNVREQFTRDTNPETNGLGGGNGFRQDRGRYVNLRLEPAEDFGMERGASPRPPTAPEDDSIVLDDVQPGRYWVRVDSSRGFAASITSGGVDLLHHTLVVGSGASPPPIEITMRDDGAQIDGTVEGAAIPAGTDPFSGTSVLPRTSPYIYCVPLPDSTGQFREIWVSPQGKFSSTQLAPGNYRLLAFDRPHSELEYHNAEAMRAYDSKGVLVRLVAGQTEHLQLPLISTDE
jgi:hypothetical protein